MTAIPKLYFRHGSADSKIDGALYLFLLICTRTRYTRSCIRTCATLSVFGIISIEIYFVCKQYALIIVFDKQGYSNCELSRFNFQRPVRHPCCIRHLRHVRQDTSHYRTGRPWWESDHVHDVSLTNCIVKQRFPAALQFCIIMRGWQTDRVAYVS